MNILDSFHQCKDWLNQSEYLKVIETIEKNPDLIKEPDFGLMLATAYIGISNGWKDRKNYEKAIQQLLFHKKFLSNTFAYVSLLGIAYLNLEQYGRALHYLRESLRKGSKSKIIEDEISFCQQKLTSPSFTEPFRVRMNKAWQAFGEVEPKVLKMLKASPFGINAAEALSISREKFEIAMDEPGLRLAMSGSKEAKEGMVFSPEGQWSKFFRQCALVLQAPNFIKQNWEIFNGEQPTGYMRLNLGVVEVDSDDWLVWFSNTKKGLKLSVYCHNVAESTAPKELYEKLAEGFINSSIGELPRMRYFGKPNVLNKPRKSPPKLMQNLGGFLKKRGFHLSLNAPDYLEGYTPYNFWVDPKVSSLPENQKPRFETLEGFTVFPDLLTEYSKGKDDLANELIACGAVPISLFFTPPEKGPLTNEKNLAYSKKLQRLLIQKCSPHSAMKVGLAHGTLWSYIDLLAWDIGKVSEVAQEFFRENPAQSYGFQVLHSEATPIYWSQ